jgi:putative flavoprotein involved in K+ transport
MSRWLQKRGVSHAVLERGRVGNTWRTQRWDSFRLNTPNVVNVLPDDAYDGEDAFGFAPHASLLEYFEDYRRRHTLPVEEGVEVTAVRPVAGGFEVQANGAARACRHVVLCSGDQNSPKIPERAGELPDDVTQLHAADYRRASDLPPGVVLVVGSGQSGVQIVEDLREAGRTVYLATSAVGRLARRYRGKDTFAWMRISGLVDQRPEDLEDPEEVRARQPQISGTRGGHTVSLQQLARDGVHLLGRWRGARARTLYFDGDLEANVAKGDEASARIKTMVDRVIAKNGLDAPAAEPDPAEEPFEGIAAMAAVRELDVDRAGIRTVLWATGFGPRFDYLDPALLDESGRPRHVGGACEVPGLYCLGFVWLRRRGSGLITGVDEDAKHIAERIATRSR